MKDFFDLISREMTLKAYVIPQLNVSKIFRLLLLITSSRFIAKTARKVKKIKQLFICINYHEIFLIIRIIIFYNSSLRVGENESRRLLATISHPILI